MKRYIAQLETVVRSVGRDVVDEYPVVRRPVLRGWQGYRRAYAHLVCARNALQYARHTELSPFEVVAVDPDQIEYLVEENGYPSQTYDTANFPASKFRYAGTVHGGDWDRCEMRFEETDLYRGFEAHFDHGVAWADTTFFDRVIEYIDDGVALWGCTSRAEFERRCERVDDLYESIRTNGYLSRQELARAESTEDPIIGDSQPVSASVCEEIAVCIGREGDMLFFDGRNRLAIAKLLDLDTVPVWILVRHEQWQAHREAWAVNMSRRRNLPKTL